MRSLVISWLIERFRLSPLMFCTTKLPISLCCDRDMRNGPALSSQFR